MYMLEWSLGMQSLGKRRPRHVCTQHARTHRPRHTERERHADQQKSMHALVDFRLLVLRGDNILTGIRERAPADVRGEVGGGGEDKRRQEGRTHQLSRSLRL